MVCILPVYNDVRASTHTFVAGTAVDATHGPSRCRAECKAAGAPSHGCSLDCPASDAPSFAQALCDAASTEHQQRVRFNVRQLGGVASSRGGRQAHQIWIDLQFADQEGRVGGDLYVLQPPAVPSEAPPPQESPPEVSSEEDAEEIERQAEPTLAAILRFGSRPRRKQDMPPAIALAAVNTVTP
jgi:hypothetical protein